MFREIFETLNYLRISEHKCYFAKMFYNLVFVLMLFVCTMGLIGDDTDRYPYFGQALDLLDDFVANSINVPLINFKTLQK